MGLVTAKQFRMGKHSSTRRVCCLSNDLLGSLSTASSTYRTSYSSSILDINPPTSSKGCSPSPASPPHLPLGRVAAGSAGSSPSFISPPALSDLGPDRKWKKTAGTAVNRFFFSKSSSALLLGQPFVPSPPLPHAMAAYAYSTSSSDISTPRSISPASVISGRSSQSSVSNKRMSISSRRISASNPMSSVDIATIEESMKLAQLDTHRGYAQNHYGQVQQYAKTEYISHNQAAGYQVLREPLWNKGKLILPGCCRACTPSACAMRDQGHFVHIRVPSVSPQV